MKEKQSSAIASWGWGRVSEMQLVNTVIPFVPFVFLGNYLLLMRAVQRIQMQFGVNFKI